MMQTLQTSDISNVSGGFIHLLLSNNPGCMGSGRNMLMKCYNADGVATRGWHTKSWGCAKWFCCSGDKGEYFHMVVGHEYYHCKTGEQKRLEVSNPDNLNGHI